MRSIRITLADDVAERAAKAAREAKFPTLGAFMVSLLGEQILGQTQEDPNLIGALKILDDVKTQIENFPSGKEFKVRALFRPDTWEEFTKGARILAGRLIYEAVKAANAANPASEKIWERLEPLEKNSAHHQIYRVR